MKYFKYDQHIIDLSEVLYLYKQIPTLKPSIFVCFRNNDATAMMAFETHEEQDRIFEEMWNQLIQD